MIRTFTDDSLEIANIESFQKKPFALSEKPSDFVIQEPQPEEMTYKQLKRHVRHLEALGVPARALEVELKMKLAFPFTCLAVIFLGIPLSPQGKGNEAALGIAAGGLITLVYLGVHAVWEKPWPNVWLSHGLELGLEISCLPSSEFSCGGECAKPLKRYCGRSLFDVAFSVDGTRSRRRLHIGRRRGNSRRCFRHGIGFHVLRVFVFSNAFPRLGIA